jgi:hypothetical protein
MFQSDKRFNPGVNTKIMTETSSLHEDTLKEEVFQGFLGSLDA